MLYYNREMKILLFFVLIFINVEFLYSQNINGAIDQMARELRTSGLFNKSENLYIDKVIRLSRDYYSHPDSIYLYTDVAGKRWVIKEYNDFFNIMQDTFRYGVSKIRNNIKDIDVTQLRRLGLIK